MPWINTQPQVLLVALLGVLLVAGVFCPVSVDVADVASAPFSESGDPLPGDADPASSPFAFISSVFSHLSAPTMTRVLFLVDLAPALTPRLSFVFASEPAAHTAPLEAPPGLHRALFLSTRALRI